jgi:hypothetical protein
MTVYTSDNSKKGTYLLTLTLTTPASTGSLIYNFEIIVEDQCSLAQIQGADHANVVYSTDFASPLLVSMGWT